MHAPLRRAWGPLRARGPHAAALLIASVALAGCTSPRLVDERRQAPYADLLARHAAAGPRRDVVAVEVPGQPPVRLGVEIVAAKEPTAAPTLVLQPGILADASTWRFLVGALAGEHEMIAIDPPGTGRSDVPDPGPRGSPAYSPTWLAAHTLAALEALEAREGRRPAYVLVGHSLGGTVVLRALADAGLRARHADLLARVRGAVLVSPGDVTLEQRNASLLEIACLSDCKAGLGENLGVMQRGVREGVRDNVVRPERDALRADALRIEALLGRPASRHAAQAMLLRFQPVDARLRTDVAAARRLADEERAIDVPVLMLWGARDRTFPRSSADAIQERLARERFVLLEEAGHSPHEERVLEVAELVRGFLAERAREASAP